MEQVNIHIKEMENLVELESQVDKEQLILCGDMQNTFLIVNFENNQKLGIAYYNYGVPLDFQYSKDSTLLYLGFGTKFLCIDIYKNKIIVNENLPSIFYELCYDTNKNYICIICELDVYCYCAEKQKWKMGFRDIIVGHNIIDDAKISLLCDDGEEYVFFLENGKITE